MKDLIKEVALEVAEKQFPKLPDEVLDFAEAFLAELSKRAEAVACVIRYVDGSRSISWSDKAIGKFPNNTQLFAFQPIHDIEAIENRVAEECAKVYLETYDLTDIADDIRSGKWRKYK